MSATTDFQLPLIFALMALLGIAVVFWRVQTGRIESPKIVIGAALLLVASGTALAILAVQDSAARAETRGPAVASK